MYHGRMSHLAPIYAVWDNNAEAMAADIGELGVTVRQWRNRNKIPQEYWRKIIDAAAQKDVALELHQFLPPNDAAKPTDEAQQANAA
jgi:hypothetical protein